MDFADWLTMTEAANLLGVSRQRIAVILDSRKIQVEIGVLETPLGRLYARADLLKLKVARRTPRRPGKKLWRRVNGKA